MIDLLIRGGAKVSYHDPHVGRITLDSGVMAGVNLTDAALRKADCTMILTDHSEIDYARVVHLSKMVFDARNATGKVKVGRKKIVKL